MEDKEELKLGDRFLSPNTQHKAWIFFLKCPVDCRAWSSIYKERDYLNSSEKLFCLKCTLSLKDLYRFPASVCLSQSITWSRISFLLKNTCKGLKMGTYWKDLFSIRNIFNWVNYFKVIIVKLLPWIGRSQCTTFLYGCMQSGCYFLNEALFNLKIVLLRNFT